MLSALIGQIYDTIVDPGIWPSVLRSIEAYVDAARSILILEDAIDTVKSAFYVSFDDPDWCLSYLETYLLLNPMRLAMVGQVGAGDILLTSDVMTVQEYSCSRFSREFLAPRQMIDVAVTMLEATATTVTVMSFIRSTEQGFADDAVRQKLELLVPHVRRAVTIGRLFENHKLQVSTLADTLDKLDGAVILLDRQATILHSNRSARRLLSSQAQAISIVDGRLCPVSPQTRAQLDDLLERASNGDVALGRDGVSISLGHGAALPLIGSVISLVDGSRREFGAAYRAVAALCIREVRFDMPNTATLLGSLYQLTRREIAVLAFIVESGGVPQTADIMGLTGETVRTHLKAIYRKTGTSRQADLVKLMASTASPFQKSE